MGIDITVKICGEAGQGIQTVGDLLASVCQQAGLYIMAINDFESRIRGGYSSFQIRISDRPITAPHHEVNLLVALNTKAYERYKADLTSDGIALVEGKDAMQEDSVHAVAFTDLAKESGNPITSNTVAAGACLSLLGAALDLFEDILKNRFSSKSGDVVKMNLAAAKLGYDAVSGIHFNRAFTWQRRTPKSPVIKGSHAISLGALAGDCRFAAFYPMSPATDILASLTDYEDDFPLVVEQAEDEIAAVNMIIGASFAGVRAMTATSGGGFCLMTEGLGLAGISETPIVIVNAQRPGPATGLPTRTAQGDLLFTINAAQDEFPRFVFAPGTVNEAYETTARAFYLAEKYQVPAIILVDQFFADSLFMPDTPFAVPERVKKFILETDDPGLSAYKRYALTDSGVSPRALPCMGKQLVRASGNEHLEDGHITEDIADRIAMVDKRNKKMDHMLKEMSPPEACHADSPVLLTGWGTTKGMVMESVDILRDRGMEVGALHFQDIWPFPRNAVRNMLTDKTIIMVEQNSTAQLGRLISEQTGIQYDHAVLKYDGRPFFPNDIANQVTQHIGSTT